MGDDDAAELLEQGRIVERVHELLRDARILRGDVERVQRMRQRPELTYDGHAVTSMLHAALVTPRQHAAATRGAEAVARAAAHVGHAVLRDSELRRAIGWPPDLEWLLEIDRESPNPRVLGRVDGALDRRGAYKVFEFNTTMTGGVLYTHAMGREYAAMAWADALRTERRVSVGDPVATAAQALRTMHGRDDLTLGLVWAHPIDLDDRTSHGRGDVVGTAAALRSHGIRVVTGTPATVTCSADGVRIGGAKVDVIATAPSIEVMMPLMSTLLADTERFRGWLATGALRFFNGISLSAAMSSKAVLAIISDPSASRWVEGLPEDVVAFARSAIPWTRRVVDGATTYGDERIELLSFLQARRDQLVLKPAMGVAGRGVVLGWKVSDEDWSRAIENALPGGGTIVQERVDVPHQAWLFLGEDGAPQRMDSMASLDLFVWNDSRAEGALCRTMPDGLANVAQGAQLIPVLVVGSEP